MNRLKAFLIVTICTLIPYCLFGVSLFFLFYIHSDLFTPYQAPDGFYVLAVFAMIALNVGSAIISPIDLMITVVADIRTPGGVIEIVKWGDGSYSAGGRGDAGAGIIILKFIINVILTPIMPLYYLVMVLMILFKPDFAKTYIERFKIGVGVLGSGVLIIGFILSSIELGCIKSNESKYNPVKMTITLSDINLEYESYYKDHYITKTYFYNISFYHPSSEIKAAEFQECIVKYDGKELDRHTMYTYIYRNGYDKNTFSLVGCFVNTYIDESYDGYDYNRIDSDYYDFHDYISFSDIDISKLEIHFVLRYAKVGKHEFSYIRTGWKDINCVINFDTF